MKISENTLRILAKVVTGDSAVTPYRSGPMLVMLFNQFGSNDCYGQGFPSRWKFAEDKLRLMNGKTALRQMVNTIFDAREFIGKEQKPEKAAEHLNQYLKFDGYELVRDGEHFKVRETGAVAVQFDTPFPKSQEVNHLFIEEQVRKCDKKIEEGDFGGAITNARSLVEAVLIEIEKQLSPNPPQYDGDLIKLNKRVQTLLNLDPARKDTRTASFKPTPSILPGESTNFHIQLPTLNHQPITRFRLPWPTPMTAMATKPGQAKVEPSIGRSLR
jgi:hypothetical protein